MAKTKVKIALGKGLNALIPTREEPRVDARSLGGDDGRSTGMIAKIDIAKVKPNRLQPRTDFDPVALEELKRSIEENGVVQAITVRRMDGGFELISGERRVRASIEAGLTEIPAYILDVRTDAQMLELALIENVQRENLNPIEVAMGYQRLIEECNLTQEELAEKIGKDRTTITNFLRVLKLPLPIQQSVRQGELSMGHARALVGIAGEKTQLEVWKKILAQSLPVRKVEALVKELEENAPRAKKVGVKVSSGAASMTSEMEKMESELKHVFASQVHIHPKAGGKGELIIEYYTPDDLVRLFEICLSRKDY